MIVPTLRSTATASGVLYEEARFIFFKEHGIHSFYRQVFQNQIFLIVISTTYYHYLINILINHFMVTVEHCLLLLSSITTQE